MGLALAWLAMGPAALAQAPDGDRPTPPGPVKVTAEWVDPSDPLLPDLETLPPRDLTIERRGGVRLLRLANLVWNSGHGVLELTGRLNPGTGKTQVHQHLYAPDESSQAVLVGEFIFHITHAHWHVEDFALYELWALDGRGLPARVVVTGTKLSYCLIDTDRVDPSNPYYEASRRYIGCGRTLQGMQPGWGDQYDADLDGQWLDISNVADGVYALRSTANPDRWLIETDYTNNSATIYVALRGNEVEVVEPPWMDLEVCATQGWC
jgi:hypothetical protein